MLFIPTIWRRIPFRNYSFYFVLYCIETQKQQRTVVVFVRGCKKILQVLPTSPINMKSYSVWENSPTHSASFYLIHMYYAKHKGNSHFEIVKYSPTCRHHKTTLLGCRRIKHSTLVNHFNSNSGCLCYHLERFYRFHLCNVLF